MFTNWKRYSLGALVLASLSLFLIGCSGGGISEAPASKTITGVVSDSTTGLPFANARVSAYAIDSAGTVSAAPLSSPATAMSDGQGAYTLKVPASYDGAVLVQATVSSGSSTKTVMPSKQSAAAAAPTVIRSVVISIARSQTVMLSLATEMVVQYIEVNKGSAFTPDNIRKAILVFEPVFGQNFSSVAPPAIGTATNPVQQGLLVTTQAVNSLLSTYTISQLVVLNPVTNTITLATGTPLATLTTALGTAASSLITTGLVSGSYTAPTVTPIPEPTQISTIPPTTPQNLLATPAITSVALSWDAAPAAENVTAYYIFRDNVQIASTTQASFPDSGLSAATAYTYQVVARDVSGNVSPSASVTVTTNSVPTCTITGKVTYNGTGLAGVNITVTGSGFGVAVTDAAGSYSFANAQAGTYTITPASAGYSFSPSSLSVTVPSSAGTVLSGNDFSAIQSGTVTGGASYPSGVVIGGVVYPVGTIISGVTFPGGTVVGGISLPSGTVVGGTSYPSGFVIAGSPGYPPGTVVGGITLPAGTVSGSFLYPSGTVYASASSPTGTVTTTVQYGTRALVSGTVKDALGNNLNGLAVVFTDVTDPAAPIASTVTTTQLGTYYFSAVQGHTYTIGATGYTFATPGVAVGDVNLVLNLVAN